MGSGPVPSASGRLAPQRRGCVLRDRLVDVRLLPMMYRISVQLDLRTSVEGYEELADVVLAEYPEDRWLINLALWDLDARTCVLAAPEVAEVEQAFSAWCQDMGLHPPQVSAAPLRPEEVAAFRIDPDDEEED